MNVLQEIHFSFLVLWLTLNVIQSIITFQHNFSGEINVVWGEKFLMNKFYVQTPQKPHEMEKFLLLFIDFLNFWYKCLTWMFGNSTQNL